MTETFKASNGWHIDGDGDLVGPTGILCTPSHRIGDAETFFQERRDHELGRWRSKEDPSWTAVRDGEIVYFQNEDGKRSFSVNADETTNHWWSGDLIDIAREYFHAHPVHKPLPTEDGLYVVSPVRDALEFALVFRLRGGEWSDVGDPERDPEVVRTAVQGLHDDAGELVRLVPEGGDDE